MNSSRYIGGICLPGHAHPLVNSQLSRHPQTECIHAYSYVESIDKQLWWSRISLATKLKLYNTCILLIFLYGSECWAITKEDACRISALHQWCQPMLLGKWYHFISNDEVRRQTNQPLNMEIIQAWHLALFGAYRPNGQQCRR